MSIFSTELFNIVLSVIHLAVPVRTRVSIIALLAPLISHLTPSLHIAYLPILSKSTPLNLLTSLQGSVQFQDGREGPLFSMPLIRQLFTVQTLKQNFSRVSLWTQPTINWESLSVFGSLSLLLLQQTGLKSK